MARAVLVGLPGSGKTSVGAALAARWGCRAVDTDDLLDAPAPDLLRRAGEAEFRRVEARALARALEGDAVVSTGGGAVVTEESREALAGQTVVWLDADDATLLERCSPGDRPLLGADPTAGIARLRAERAPLYAAVSSARVDATGTVEEVADRVAAVVAP